MYHPHPTLRCIAAACAISCGLGLATTASQAQTSAADQRNLQVVASSAVTANRTQRVALVIGNASYREAPLLNPVNDARAIAKALQDTGFTVILRENTDQRGMMSALREFGDKLRAGGVGVFYYAGHGMQIKGRNYLIPVGANVEREDEVAYSTVDAQAVLDKMEAAGNASNIMILDACRNNPFTRSTRSGQTGLAQMDAPVGTLVAFATSPGAVASDGAGVNGLYTQHLLDAMRKPGLKVEDVFKQVRANVRRDSQGKQVPWEATSLEGDFYFRQGAVGSEQSTAARPVATESQIEMALWDAVKNSTLPIELRAYLNRYPQGRFAGEARERIANLQKPTITAITNAPVRPTAASVAAPPSTTAPVVASTPSAQDDQQAAVDRRTEELLKQLAVSVPSATPVAAMPVAASRPVASSNSFGFTVGDRWRYQNVDRFKKEVVDNWARQIESIQADGNLRLNGGRVIWNAKGGVQRIDGSNGRSRAYSAEFQILPDQLREGWQQSANHTLTWRNEDGQNGVEERVAKLRVLGREKVSVPAGSFDAWKIEWAGDSKGRNLVNNNNYYRTFKEVWWYVPELRNFVASEIEWRASGSIESYSRIELTSYSVRGADEALAKR